jgi:hypothetical protein
MLGQPLTPARLDEVWSLRGSVRLWRMQAELPGGS